MISNDAPSGGAPPNWGGPGDGTNNIFNWELNPVGGGPGVNLTGNGTNQVFFQDTGSQGTTVQQWIDYNAAGDPVAPTTWNDSTNGNTPTTGAPTGSLAGIYVTTDGTNYYAATPADMMGITSKGTNCLQDLIANNMGYPGTPDACGNSLNAMSGAYGRSMGSGLGANATMNQYWSNVDAIKKDITAGFNTPYVGVSAPAGKSGLGAYKVGRSGSTWSDDPWNAGNAPPLEKANATVFDLLNQVGGCATTSVVQDIWQRCNEIAPGTSYNDVVALLSSPSATLIMGQTLYIRRINASDMNSKLTIAAAPPVALTATPQPDGNPNIGAATCDSGAYDLYNGGYGLIDSKAGAAVGDGKGDNNLHDQPYTVVASDLSATDHANFIVSSGAHGMLGKLEFYQTTTGTGAFSRPN